MANQYSLPVLPFLFVAVVHAATLKDFRFPVKWVLIWSFLALLALGEFPRLGYNFFKPDIRSTLTVALKHIDTQESVLTTSIIAPHLSHRTVLELPESGKGDMDLSRYRYILFNLDDPFFGSSNRTVRQLTARLRKSADFATLIDKNHVVLFKQK